MLFFANTSLIHVPTFHFYGVICDFVVISVISLVIPVISVISVNRHTAHGLLQLVPISFLVKGDVTWDLLYEFWATVYFRKDYAMVKKTR